METKPNRLSEIEGVLFGLTQVLVVLIQTHPNPVELRDRAKILAEDFQDGSLNSGFDDYALEQADATFRTLFELLPGTA